ncbi:hypothetical protein [Kitasatospora cineracea]
MKLNSFVVGLVVVLLVAGSLTVWTSAPCGLWTYAAAGETPARCLR